MFEYRKSGLDSHVLRLLKKLEPDFPNAGIIKDFEQNWNHIVKVFFKDECYGILVLRFVRYHSGEYVMVVDHAIAEDELNISFSSILGETLFTWAESLGFDMISQHAHRAGLCKMLEKYYGSPSEIVYKKRLKCQKANHQVQQAKLPQIRTTGLRTIAE